MSLGDLGTSAPGQPLKRSATIRNQRGLHARAAGKFVKLAGNFNADILVGKGGQHVSGMSIMGLMMLAAGIGSTIELEISGSQADEAMAALIALVEAGFEED